MFIDPYRINEKENKLFNRARKKILNYFDLFFYFVEHNLRNDVEKLGLHLHEINATKLGYTTKGARPNGRGFCQRDLLCIFDEVIKIKDYIEDMPDILILAQNVGPDKVSDLTTNIIYEELLEFTIGIINKYDLGIELRSKKKWIFDINKQEWGKKTVLVPHIDSEEILFLPIEMVVHCEIFSYTNVYTQLVYPFYKNNTAVHGLIRLLKDGEERPDCKKIREKYQKRRDVVMEFKQNYPDEYNAYKKKMIEKYWGNTES